MSHFSIKRGTTLSFQSTAKKTDGTVYPIGVSGTPPAGTRLLFVAKVNQTDPDSAAVALFDNLGVGSTQGSIAVTNGAAGIFVVTMLASTTYSLPTSVAGLWYELYIHAAASETWELEHGDIQLTPRLLVQQP